MPHKGGRGHVAERGKGQRASPKRMGAKAGGRPRDPMAIADKLAATYENEYASTAKS